MKSFGTWMLCVTGGALFVITILLVMLHLDKQRTLAAQHRTAQYVRDHHCKVIDRTPGRHIWLESEGRLSDVKGNTLYACTAPDLLIRIYSDQEQP